MNVQNAIMYFLNLIGNITDKAEFLKNITPFGYCDGADIVADGELNGGRIGIGLAICIVFIACAYFKYPKKDIH